MCGVAGVLAGERVNAALVRRLTAPLSHRGPDDQGIWIDAEAGIGLGHRRLSIIDLSPLGHQPMQSADGRWVLSYNGEIYNHKELRAELDASGTGPAANGIGWRGHSDTEVLVECIAAWGLEAALAKSVGMFALAAWDRKERCLQIARDRFGEKPLYYGWVGTDFVFASELKGIRAHPGFDGEIDRRALGLFASRTYIPAPLSIYKRIFKLPPGSILTVPSGTASVPLDVPPREGDNGGLRLKHYWSYRAVVEAGLADPIRDESDALDELDHALSRAVADQSVADVPVGMFLSGGIDSSTIAAFYQRTSKQPVRTFSIGFEDKRYNEAPFAAQVAEQLGTVHHEQIVTERDALDTIPLLPTIYDEPFADSSQIPTFLVSRMARREVTVALTGDGGDELFGGYYRHFYAPRLWRQIRRVPAPIRAAGAPLGRIPSDLWSRAGGLFPTSRRSHVGAKIQKGLRISSAARSMDDVYASFLDEWSLEASPALDSDRGLNTWDLDVGNNASDEVRIMYCDAVSYLPDDILCKVDRASMAVSLETRVPFLDHRVARIAARIDVGLKMRNGEGKTILRKLLYREAPRSLFERPKAGFAIPVGDWLRGPLRSWAEELLSERRLASEGWFDVAAVRGRWRDHLSGRRDSAPAIWAILMFEAWLDQQRAPAAAAA